MFPITNAADPRQSEIKLRGICLPRSLNDQPGYYRAGILPLPRIPQPRYFSLARVSVEIEQNGTRRKRSPYSGNLGLPDEAIQQDYDEILAMGYGMMIDLLDSFRLTCALSTANSLPLWN
jgi:hypothetical protein